MFGGFYFGQPLFGDGPPVVVPVEIQPDVTIAVRVRVESVSLALDLLSTPAAIGTSPLYDAVSLGMRAQEGPVASAVDMLVQSVSVGDFEVS